MADRLKRVIARLHQEDAKDAAIRIRSGVRPQTQAGETFVSNVRTPHIGSTLDDLLEEDGVLAEAHAIAIKRALAWQVSQTMAEEKLSKAEMARRMRTSRAALDRFLDPDNPSVTLLTMDKAASVLGKRLKVELTDEVA